MYNTSGNKYYALPFTGFKTSTTGGNSLWSVGEPIINSSFDSSSSKTKFSSRTKEYLTSLCKTKSIVEQVDAGILTALANSATTSHLLIIPLSLEPYKSTSHILQELQALDKNMLECGFTMKTYDCTWFSPEHLKPEQYTLLVKDQFTQMLTYCYKHMEMTTHVAISMIPSK